MPGVDCSVFGCGSNRRMKGVGIFRLPAENVDKEWRACWLNELTKSRVIDTDFRKQICENKVHTCEKHFRAEDIETCKCMFTIVLFLNLNKKV